MRHAGRAATPFHVTLAKRWRCRVLTRLRIHRPPAVGGPCLLIAGVAAFCPIVCLMVRLAGPAGLG